MQKSLPLVAKAFLDTIGEGEGTGSRYDILFGGGRFSSYADHPRTTVEAWGKKSDTAGRYQFKAKTWDEQAKKYGLEGFSPDNQDVVAWEYAKQKYAALAKNNRGLSLQAALESDDPAVLTGVADALKGIWSSLPGGREQAKGNTQSRFKANFDANAAKWAGQANGDDPYATNKSATPAGVPSTINQASGGVLPYEGILPAPSTGDVTLPFLQDPPLNGGSAGLDVLRLDPTLAIPPRPQFDAVYDPWTGTMVPTAPTTNGAATSIDDSGWVSSSSPRASATVPGPTSNPLGAINAIAAGAAGAGPNPALGYANGGHSQGWNLGFPPAGQPSPSITNFYNTPGAGLQYANPAMGPNYGAANGFGGPVGPANSAPLSDFESQMARVPSSVIPKYIPVTHHVPNPAYVAQFGALEPPMPDFMGMLASRWAPNRTGGVDPSFGQAPAGLGASPGGPMSDYLLDKTPPPLSPSASPSLPPIHYPDAVRAILEPALAAIDRRRAMEARQAANGPGGSLTSAG